MDLPSYQANVHIGAINQETRVHCRCTEGVTWQFKVGARNAYAQIFFRLENGLIAYQELGFQCVGGATEHINGARFHGADALIEDWPQIVQSVVQSMSGLWEMYGEGLP